METTIEKGVPSLKASIQRDIDEKSYSEEEAKRKLEWVLARAKQYADLTGKQVKIVRGLCYAKMKETRMAVNAKGELIQIKDYKKK